MLVLVLIAVFAAVPVVSVAADCQADVTAKLFGTKKGRDATEYVWKVDITTRAECAKVQFVLSYTETDNEGNEQAYRLPMSMKVRSGTTSSRKVTRRIDSRHSMSNWRFEVSRCDPCGGV